MWNISFDSLLGTCKDTPSDLNAELEFQPSTLHVCKWERVYGGKWVSCCLGTTVCGGFAGTWQQNHGSTGWIKLQRDSGQQLLSGKSSDNLALALFSYLQSLFPSLSQDLDASIQEDCAHQSTPEASQASSNGDFQLILLWKGVGPGPLPSPAVISWDPGFKFVTCHSLVDSQTPSWEADWSFKAVPPLAGKERKWQLIWQRSVFSGEMRHFQRKKKPSGNADRNHQPPKSDTNDMKRSIYAGIYFSRPLIWVDIPALRNTMAFRFAPPPRRHHVLSHLLRNNTKEEPHDSHDSPSDQISLNPTMWMTTACFHFIKQLVKASNNHHLPETAISAAASLSCSRNCFRAKGASWKLKTTLFCATYNRSCVIVSSVFQLYQKIQKHLEIHCFEAATLSMGRKAAPAYMKSKLNPTSNLFALQQSGIYIVSAWFLATINHPFAIATACGPISVISWLLQLLEQTSGRPTAPSVFQRLQWPVPHTGPSWVPQPQP